MRRSWSGGRQTSVHDTSQTTHRSDLIFQGLERTDPNAARRRLRLDHDLFAGERVDALASLACRLVDRRELRNAGHREFADALRLEMTGDVFAERLDDAGYLPLRQLRLFGDCRCKLALGHRRRDGC